MFRRQALAELPPELVGAWVGNFELCTVLSPFRKVPIAIR